SRLDRRPRLRPRRRDLAHRARAARPDPARASDRRRAGERAARRMSLERTASRPTLELRAELLARVRSFFAARGVLEVETPALSAAGVSDPALEQIVATARALGE